MDDADRFQNALGILLKWDGSQDLEEAKTKIQATIDLYGNVVTRVQPTVCGDGVTRMPVVIHFRDGSRMRYSIAGGPGNYALKAEHAKAKT